jgi:hypothetical protein
MQAAALPKVKQILLPCFKVVLTVVAKSLEQFA